MTDPSRERPCIHVCLVDAAPSDLDRWVEVGAEEEGIPMRSVPAKGTDVVAAAYAAAQSSRVDVGVAVAADRVVLHEVHMPPQQPVLVAELGTDPRRICRRMGGNAARLVARLPLRIEDEPEDMLPVAEQPRRSAERRNVTNRTNNSVGDAVPPVFDALGENGVRRIVELVAAIVKERGLQ